MILSYEHGVVSRVVDEALTEWVYDHCLDLRGKTYHVWVRPHREGYIAYTLTSQPANGSGCDYVKPKRTAGHWTGQEAFERYVRKIQGTL